MIIDAYDQEDNAYRNVIIDGHTLRVRADGEVVELVTSAGQRELEQIQDRWGKGYLRVSLPKRTVAVHKLVALAWHGEPPTPDHVLVEHLDGSRSNNHKGNVRWATFSDNLNSALRLNERDRKYDVKLDENAVYAIRTRRARTEIPALADEYGTGEQTIRDVFDGNTWRRVRTDQPRLPDTF